MSNQGAITWNRMVTHPMGKVLIEAFELCLKKNADYGTKEEMFSNFMSSKRLGDRPSKGCATRLEDKVSRFEKGVRTDWQMDVEDELMEDTIKDLINYCAIYWCLWKMEQGE